MKKLLATLITALFATVAVAQTPAPASAPKMEMKKGEMKKDEMKPAEMKKDEMKPAESKKEAKKAKKKAKKAKKAADAMK